MELAHALVVLVGPPYTACEEFLCEGCALYGLTMPISGRRFIISANSVSVQVSRSSVRVAAVRCGVVVSTVVLTLRLRDVSGVRPPMW